MKTKWKTKTLLFSLAMTLKLVVLTLIIPILICSTLLLLHNLNSNEASTSAHNNIGRLLEVIPIPDGAVGPESLVFDSLGGGPYTGVSDGRIIKWKNDERRWIDFATTSSNRERCDDPKDQSTMEHICGRPLGLRFNETNDDLFIADAYKGLLVVGALGGLATLSATEAQGVAFGFTNSLDTDHSFGSIYFTDSSLLFQRRSYLSAILSGDKSGRLMKCDSESKEVSVLVENLKFPNGVAVSKDGSFILVAETTNCRILRYWIKTQKIGDVEVFAQLPGFPDNIKISPRGGFWVTIHSKRKRVLEWVLDSHPWIGNGLIKIIPMDDLMKFHAILGKYSGNNGMAVRLSDDGEVVEIFEGLGPISEVVEKDGKLWIGSVTLPFISVFRV